jgi:hypothetical protein
MTAPVDGSGVESMAASKVFASQGKALQGFPYKFYLPTNPLKASIGTTLSFRK